VVPREHTFTKITLDHLIFCVVERLEKTESELQKLAAGYVHFISGRDRSGRSLLALPNVLPGNSNLNIDSKSWQDIIHYATKR
jgi:hypothetical protein